MPEDIKIYIEQLKQCTLWEYESEEHELKKEMERHTGLASEQKGLRFSNLKIHSMNPGFNGQYLIELFKKRGLKFSFAAMNSGSVVQIFDSTTNQPICEGVIHTIDAVSLKIIIPDPIKLPKEEYGLTVELRPNRITLDRMLLGLSNVSSLSNSDILPRVLLGKQINTSDHSEKIDFTPSKRLNSSQQEAIKFACDGSPLTILHGPPGTGKTSTLLYLVGTYAQQGKSVLVAAGSNAAVDNVALSLIKMGVPIVRVGNPERFHPELQEFTLENVADRAPSGKKILTFKHELDQEVRKKNNRLRNKKFIRSEDHKGDLDLIKSYRLEIKRLENLCIQELSQMGHVFISTHTGAGHASLKSLNFDLVVCEEAGQTLEPLMFLSMLKAKKWVLAGDHFQLPPVVISDKAKAAGFEESLMEKLTRLHPTRVCMLKVQYRMHDHIQNFSSKYFYNNELTCGPNIEERADLPALRKLNFESRIVFIDTKGLQFHEESGPDSGGLKNSKEAKQLFECCQNLITAGIESDKIGVIAPYRGQVQLLKNLLPKEIEVSTVDSYQGREKDFMLISLTRSNPEKEIGFLSEVRRMNVAITRAKEFLWVIGDSDTVSTHPFYKEFISYVQSVPGAYKTNI